MIILDEHIKEAEKLLINEHSFDKVERVPFIKHLESCDLLAVPGSGKTTALLAKLYCISKHLPFKDGSGVLILSHTNAAVEEIEKNLKKHCPVLFEYPNFIGTVQSFISKFFVLPYFSQYLGGQYVSVDGGKYSEEITKKLSSSRNSEIAYYKYKQPSIFYNSRFWFDADDKVIISEGISCSKLKLNIPQKWIRENTADGKIKNVYDFISQMKREILVKGILDYDDCYFLARKILLERPQVKELLQNRFKYVFIDEMQDLEHYQIGLIDEIFYSNNSISVMQRIGDINQSIYSSGRRVKVEADWKPRNQLYFKGSNRLTKEVTSVVNHLTLDMQLDDENKPRFVLNGLSDIGRIIKPHLLLFDVESKDMLEMKFRELIKMFSLHHTMEGERYGFKIIGWNAKWNNEEDSEKLRLEDIFTSFSYEKSYSSEVYDSLSKYIQLFDHNDKTLGSAQKSLFHVLIHVLRLENKKYNASIRGRQVERYYSVNEMIKYIKDRGTLCDYELFKKTIYELSFIMASWNMYDSVYEKFKSFIIDEFKSWFGLDIKDETKIFLGDQFQNISISNMDEEINVEKDDDIPIEIGTVHSVKGQTHCATMYVETAYQRPTYETKKIIKKNANPLLLQEHKCNGKYDRQALKMMYVGFSRPTHLLCFACLKENISNVGEYKDAGWEIVDLTEKDEKN